VAEGAEKGAASWDGSDPLPADPVAVIARWLDEAFAAGAQANPHAAALATVEPDGGPGVRMVLCKAIDVARGSLTFYTHRSSRKGRALAAHPRAALCFYFGPQNRQVRVAGPVELASDADSDAYFATRPVDARVGAWASRQSEPIDSREELHRRARETAARFGLAPGWELGREGDVAIPRPRDWGGYLVLAESVELWISGPARIHDRALFRRRLEPTPRAWSAERLQP
jgi:pyridoxamine 5'-phosphate oxidase